MSLLPSLSCFGAAARHLFPDYSSVFSVLHVLLLLSPLLLVLLSYIIVILVVLINVADAVLADVFTCITIPFQFFFYFHLSIKFENFTFSLCTCL